MNSQQPKVLIVGAGPTGLTAALELSRLQIPVRIIEKASAPSTTSRAIGVQARTLELFAQRGLTAPLLEKGNRAAGASIYAEGKRLFRLDISLNGSEYGYILFISQAETEAILRAALQRQQVTIEREVELVALSQTEHRDPLRAILKHGDGALEEVDCEYLIDSEGAHSIVRTTLNLQFRGKTREENYALGDLFVEGDLPSTDVHIFASQHGFLGMFPMGGSRFRLIASNPFSKPSRDTAPALDELQKMYDQRSGIPAKLHDLNWSSWFWINSRMVESLRVGRVFLGGDSAHIHSPAGAQGMNTGIQDMINLSWKLALVIRQQADPKLLDTYNDDRLPVIRNVLAITEDLTDAIGIEKSVLRSTFHHVAPWLVGREKVQETGTRRMSQISLNYRDSPLSVSQHAPGGLRAGDRVPDLEVQVSEIPVIDGELRETEGATVQAPGTARLFSLFSPDRFTLLFANAVEPVQGSALASLSPWKQVLQTCHVAPFAAADALFSELFGKGRALILVRPDGYAAFVCALGATGSTGAIDSLSEYLQSWFPAPQR